MIARPTVESLLAKCGNTPDGRKTARAEMRRAMLARAEREIAIAGFSHRCAVQTEYHGPDHEPCGNRNGAGCLCPCHDATTGGQP